VNTDFLDAHERHWDDAELLKTNLRHANADHLYGMSAECGLKCLMIQFGMSMSIRPDGTGIPGDQKDRVHSDKIWDRFESYRSGHHQGARYILTSPNPFMDWDVNQRYASRSDFDETRVESHRQGTEKVRELIAMAQKDGLI
jgi:hypothetical protein